MTYQEKIIEDIVKKLDNDYYLRSGEFVHYSTDNLTPEVVSHFMSSKSQTLTGQEKKVLTEKYKEGHSIKEISITWQYAQSSISVVIRHALWVMRLCSAYVDLPAIDVANKAKEKKIPCPDDAMLRRISTYVIYDAGFITKRVWKCLPYQNLKELQKVTEKELLEVTGIGVKGVQMLVTALEQFSISIREEKEAEEYPFPRNIVHAACKRTIERPDDETLKAISVEDLLEAEMIDNRCRNSLGRGNIKNLYDISKKTVGELSSMEILHLHDGKDADHMAESSGSANYIYIGDYIVLSLEEDK